MLNAALLRTRRTCLPTKKNYLKDTSLRKIIQEYKVFFRIDAIAHFVQSKQTRRFLPGTVGHLTTSFISVF
jgi:hypothetical protein